MRLRDADGRTQTYRLGGAACTPTINLVFDGETANSMPLRLVGATVRSFVETVGDRAYQTVEIATPDKGPVTFSVDTPANRNVLETRLQNLVRACAGGVNGQRSVTRVPPVAANSQTPMAQIPSAPTPSSSAQAELQRRAWLALQRDLHWSIAVKAISGRRTTYTLSMTVDRQPCRSILLRRDVLERPVAGVRQENENVQWSAFESAVPPTSGSDGTFPVVLRGPSGFTIELNSLERARRVSDLVNTLIRACR